jgi:hypothetical protein
MKRIDLIAGARSNFMKNASIINPLINANMQVVSITEGTTVLGVSSLALRDNTERHSTVTLEQENSLGLNRTSYLLCWRD